MACPICVANAKISESRPYPGGRVGHLVECRRCGSFFLSFEALQDTPGILAGDADRIARVGYGVRRMQCSRQPPYFLREQIANMLATPLPSVFEQANNLVRWLGENGKGPGETEGLAPSTHQFIIGAKTPDGFALVVDHLFDTGYLTGRKAETMGEPGRADATLTFRGWEHFDQLQRGEADSRTAFMAMKYGDADTDELVNKVFRPAVAQTGFALVRLDDRPEAGLIDDRLRVQIRTARFLIADLSHGNQGAYWEAGYAEGLGKPVIYTCERKAFELEKTHFDTNHHLTVVWDIENAAQAAEQLKATIRATLPGEAKLTD